MDDRRPVLVAQIGLDYRYLSANEAYLVWFGLPPEQVIGHRVPEVVGEEVYAIVRPYMERAMRGETMTFEADYPSGAHVESTFAPRLLDGQVQSIIVLTRDVTHIKETQRQLRNSEQRFALAVRGMNDGIWDMDPRTSAIYFSPRYKEMLGYSDEEIVNHIDTVRALIHPEDWDMVTGAVARYLTREAPDYRSVFRMKHKSGEWRWIMCRGAAEFDDTGQATRFTGSHTDITETKLLEDELRKARDHAEAANTAKTDFLANMSHEIRTPMNAIIGLSNILESSQPLSESQRKFITTLQLSAESLLRLINDMLDIAKIEDNMIEFELIPFSVHELLERVVGMMAVKAAKKEVDLRVHYATGLHDRLIGDPGRIQQILVNLVDNAIKFTPAGQVTIELSEKPVEQGVRLSFRVVDTGVGIPESKLYAIFEKFTQADASITRQYGGTGLGLTICKTMSERMGGSIHVASKPGEGAAFTVNLPLALDPAAIPTMKEALPMSQDATQAGHRILLVEDYEPNILVATTLLESFGYEFAVVKSGADALLITEGQTFDLILMDVQMQDMDGLETTRRLRQREQKEGRPHTTIFAMTAHALTGDREKCLAAGMDDYISKPFNPSLLESKLAAVLQK